MRYVQRFIAARWLAAGTQLAGICIVLVVLNVASMPTASGNAATELWQQPTWLKLGHYEKSLAGGYTSTADSSEFFLAATGKTDPEAELNATIAALQLLSDTTSSNQHASCRFPARAAWLSTQLPLSIPDAVCADYVAFLKRWQPEQITLIFADAYLSNPASSFGHTFLRLDPAPDADGDTQPILLNGTIDFAAYTGDARGLAYGLGGLLGRFPGRFSVLPYYIQVNEYNYGALRDLWEYPIKLNAAERAMLMAHLWELRDTVFDYYFIDENCSSQLLALLGVVKPELDLFAGIGATVIPGETVRALKKYDLLGTPTFRPALDSIVQTASLTLTPEAIHLARELSDGSAALGQLADYSDLQQVRILDVAYDLLRLREQRGDINNQIFAELGRPLLLARAKRSLRSDFPTVAPPAEEPAIDHGAARLRGGLSHGDHTNGVLGWRLVYHDLLDPRLATPRGSEVRAFDFTASIREGNWRLESADLISLRSLTPQTAVLQPWSWQLSTGIRRHTAGKIAYAEYGRGLTWANAPDNLIYGMLVADVQANLDGQALAKGYRMGAGLQLGWLHTPDRWNTTQLELDWRAGTLGDHTESARVSLQHQWSFDETLGLRWSLHSHYQDNRWEQPTGQLTVEWYL